LKPTEIDVVERIADGRLRRSAAEEQRDPTTSKRKGSHSERRRAKRLVSDARPSEARRAED
ncbi:hypothetical protein WAJ11_20920, partial [Acinetobacter baumannii]